MYNRLDTIPACDGRSDRQTDILPRHSRAMHMRRVVKARVPAQPRVKTAWSRVHLSRISTSTRQMPMLFTAKTCYAQLCYVVGLSKKNSTLKWKCITIKCGKSYNSVRNRFPHVNILQGTTRLFKFTSQEKSRSSNECWATILLAMCNSLCD